MKAGFEKIDLELLKEIQRNCKYSLKELSKKLRVPMSTIHDKTKKFERDGVIKSYAAILDQEKVNKPATAFILLSVRHYFPDEPESLSQRDIAKKIAQLPLVQEVHIINGEWDILLKAKGESVKEIGNFVIDHLRKIKGVDRTLTIDSVVSTKESPEIFLGKI